MSKYRVWWFSPRGFANEGDYVFGSREDCDELLDGEVNATLMSKHLSIEAARLAAERLERKDRRNTPSHEICSIGVMDAAEVLRERA